MDETSDGTADVGASGEEQRSLFNGTDLVGWTGDPEFWSVADGTIVGRNDTVVPTSTYLFSADSFRDFRLTLQVKQTRGAEYSTMHSAVAALGEQFADGDNAYGFRGPLLMFCGDWGIFDAYGRRRVVPREHDGFWEDSAELVGEWNTIEILVLGDRIRMAANGQRVFDFTDEPGRLKTGPLGLQLHSNEQPQEFAFRDIVIAESPEDRLLTVED